MKHLLTLFAVTVFGLSAMACRDPEVAKRKYLQKGDALMAQGNAAEAALNYRNAIKLDKRFGEARFALAEAYGRTDNPQGAIQELVRAADLLPNRADVQLKAATTMLAAKHFEEARKYAENALKVDPKLAEAHLARAYALTGQRDTKSAIQELEKAMLDSPRDARLYSGMGGVRAAAGDTVEAEKSLRQAIGIDPTSVPCHLALAYYLWSAGKKDEVEPVLKQAIAIRQDDADANRMLSLFLLAQGRTSDAETPLLRLVNAKDSTAAMTLADLYVQTGRQDQARPLYASLKENDAMRPVAVSRLAALEYAAGRRDQAHGMLDAELKSKPNNHVLLMTKAEWLASERKGEEAFQIATKMVSEMPDAAESQYVLGLAREVRGENEEAIEAYTKALRLDLHLTIAEIQLSRLLLQRGDIDQALQHATAATKAQPGNPDARFVRSKVLLANGDLAGAETELKALREQHQDSADISSTYGLLLQAKRDQTGATREFERALRLDPADLPALHALMQSDLQQKKPDDARVRLKNALAKQPNRAALLILGAQFEHSLGNFDPAEGYLRHAVEAEPTNRDAYTQLALFYMDRKKLDQAKKQLTEYAARKPDSVPTLTMIGMIEEMQGRPDAAITVYEGIVKNGAKAPIAANNLAYLYTERGVQLDIALQLAQSAKQQLPDNPDVSDTLGWAYVKKGMANLAIKPLQFSVNKAPSNPEYLAHLGIAYAKAGRSAEARDTLNRALRLQPNFSGSSEAREALASLNVR